MVIFIYLIRLFYMQVINDSYKNSADNNSQRYVTQYPARGLIFDRNGVLIVCNEAAYDLMINPQELRQFDTVELTKILKVDSLQIREGIRKAKAYSRFKPSPFLYQLSDVVYAVLQEKLYKFPGFFVQPRTLRKYNKKTATHIMGYVGEVDSSVIRKDSYYQMGDYIGMSGIEKSYEKELRGKKGVNIYLVDVHNRIKGSFQDGKYDTAAVFGNNLYSSIDLRIQEYGEKLMKPFKGSIVAIEPATGEILTLISSPGYDPQLLVGRERSKNYSILRQDPLLPLFNRALMAKYPPGSTFKILNALVGLKQGVVTPETRFSCAMGITMGPIHVGCHAHPTPLDMAHSIQYSCNAYYDLTFRRIIDNPAFTSREDSYNEWRRLALTFGFGRKLHCDIPNELNGNIPTADYYNRIYGRKGWNSLTIISLAIGQGELGITPLQMANMAATISNRGYYYTPHIVKKIENIDTINHRFSEKHYTAFSPELFETVIHGMEMAVNGPNGGTASWVKMDNIIMCGKTGTAQNPHGQEDHSIFIAFAPKDNPKIAISVYIEHGGFGATYAAPIASLLIEKYLTDSISRPWIETYLLNAKINYNEKNR